VSGQRLLEWLAFLVQAALADLVIDAAVADEEHERHHDRDRHRAKYDDR